MEKRELHQLLGFLELPLASMQSLRPSMKMNPVYLAYADAVMAYLAADFPRHKEAIRNLEAQVESCSEDARVALSLARARLEIRDRAVTSGTVQSLDCSFKSISSDDLWRGEVAVVFARVLEVLFRDQEAEMIYQYLSEWCAKHGFKKRAMLFRLNRIAAYSRCHPEGNYIVEYQSVVRDARKIRDHGTAAIALLNISRELHASGAFYTALRYVNRCIALYSREKNTLACYLAHVHRAHIYLGLGAPDKAQEDMTIAGQSYHAEIIASLRQLKSLQITGNFDQETLSDLTISWREKVRMNVAQEQDVIFASLEDALIRCLALGPKTRDQLMRYLWGDHIDPESRIMRFKRLVQRIRKKRPELLECRNGQYSLSAKSDSVRSAG